MTLEIHVIYKAPSRERLFLGNGWGIRDVRGPYLSLINAEIVIGNWALSPKVPSTIDLTLSLSSRCEVDALFVEITSVSESRKIIIERNDSTNVSMPNIFANMSDDNAVIIVKQLFQLPDGAAALGDTGDIVAIDELRLTR